MEIVVCPGIDEIQLIATNTCIGGMNGAIQLSVTGGVEPLTYEWSNNAISESLEDLGAGEYCVTVTDANGCAAEGCATVISEQILTLALTSTNTCAGSSTGTGTVSLADGGTLPYSYLWSNGETSTSIDDLPVGNYWLTLTDADGCFSKKYTEVESLNVPLIYENITYSTCENIEDGSISLNIGGGDPPHTFEWSNGETTPTITNLAGGDYCVTVTTVNSCSATDCYSTLPTGPQQEAPYIKKVQVFSEAVSNGTQTLIYDAEWVPASSGCIVFTGGMQSISDELFESMQAGGTNGQNFIVEVTTNKALDELSLVIGGISSDGNISEPSVFFSFIAAANFVSSFTSGGILQVGLIFSGQDLANNDLIDLRTASMHMTQCTEIPQLNPDCSWSPIQPTGFDDVHILERSCAPLFFTIDENAGAIGVQMPEGTPPFSIHWSGPGYENNENVTKIYPPKSGEYCVTVTDASGCTAEGCITYCDGFAEAVQLQDFITFSPTCPDGTGGSICLDPENY